MPLLPGTVVQRHLPAKSGGHLGQRRQLHSIAYYASYGCCTRVDRGTGAVHALMALSGAVERGVVQLQVCVAACVFGMQRSSIVGRRNESARVQSLR